MHMSERSGIWDIACDHELQLIHCIEPWHCHDSTEV